MSGRTHGIPHEQRYHQRNQGNQRAPYANPSHAR
ncbi:MAG: hypothetical protein QOD45_6 [Pseudonocardiales bacterium]|jgi:hypothetical protein|nr:hypothetical protein [Pseudonocardiales bacterium]